MERSYLERLAIEAKQSVDNVKSTIVNYANSRNISIKDYKNWYLSDIADILIFLNVSRTSKNAELLINTIASL